MNKFILATILFFTTSLAYAIDFVVPKQMIIGAEKPYPTAETVFLKISPIDNVPQYLKNTNYRWIVLNQDGSIKDNIIIWPDNTAIFFSTGKYKTSFTIMLVIDYTYAVNDEQGKIKEFAVKHAPIIRTKVIVDDDNSPSPPNPGPGPNPNPDPVFPPGKFGLSKTVYDLAKTKVNLSSADKQKCVVALAESFNSMKSKAAAGVVPNIKVMLEETNKSNDLALDRLGTQYRPYWREFSVALQDKLYDLYITNKLTTMQHYVDAWTEISLGLSAVK